MGDEVMGDAIIMAIASLVSEAPTFGILMAWVWMLKQQNDLLLSVILGKDDDQDELRRMMRHIDDASQGDNQESAP